MERIFKIRMHVPLGYRDGTLSFTKKDDQKIEGALCLFQNEDVYKRQYQQCKKSCKVDYEGWFRGNSL